ncbi:hypothetical protein CC80DRAFT_272442 [Byssothecium circinans]|uniref:Uncharacterized protein n=1 Tax=Byssothecium circinans TaxID=147558 RepID=A0A6A5TA56_9PLEO|nr:hypothetical protein CC80DRAFT_272442 [Byssothecium circinans]
MSAQQGTPRHIFAISVSTTQALLGILFTILCSADFSTLSGIVRRGVSRLPISGPLGHPALSGSCYLPHST